MIVAAFYLTLLLLSVWAEFLLLQKISNRRASYYVALFTLISVVCLAYFAYSIALDTSMALVANQFSYLDATFVMMFFIFCILDICNIRVTRWFAVPMVLIGLSILALAFTAGYNQLLYKNVKIAHYAGAAHLRMEFGPLYYPFMIYVVATVMIPMGIVVYSAFHKRQISYKYTMALGLILIAIVALYFVQLVFGRGVDLLPFGYVMMEYVILAVIHRIGLYDVSQMAVNVREDNKEYGCIIFDMNRCYVGANETALYYFPELKELEIDREVSNPWIAKEFIEWIDVFNGGNTSSKKYVREGRSLMCSMKPYSFGDKKKLYGYVVEIWDDTEQQKFIDTLNDMNEELAQAVETANAASEAKSQFLANISHEIRTPINAILGMNEIALRECNDESLISYMHDIQNAGNNLLAIVNDILDFSKIEAGKIDIIEDNYELSRLIKDAIDLVEIKAKDKGLKLIINADPELPSVLYGDVNRIRQIMINLLNNSVKYTHTGSVELNISAEKKDEAFVELKMVVKDTGIGIKQEDIGQLFESFSRVDEKKNKNIEGTGLGLAITGRLVDMMKGSINVESVYGEGSTFTVILPQKVIDGKPIGNFSRRTNAKKEEKKHIDATGVKLLIVDDLQLNLTVAKGLLKPTNAEVTTCTSGKECIEILKNRSFDIVFLDHMMPEMDGIETLKQIKASTDVSAVNANTKFIALTANAISGVRDTYLAAGFDDYLSKPINPMEMEELIKGYCL